MLLGAPEATSDGALLREAQTGSREAAFTRLFERHKDAVFGFLLHVLRDRALAEDLLQEVFYRLYRSLDRCDPARPFKPYLHAIVHNAVLDAFEARRKERDAGPAPAPARPDDPLAAAERHEEELRARDAYDALPDETRLLLHQRHGLDMKLDELATTWRVTEKTVRNRLKAAARDLVRVFFERRGVDSRGGRP